MFGSSSRAEPSMKTPEKPTFSPQLHSLQEEGLYFVSTVLESYIRSSVSTGSTKHPVTLHWSGCTANAWLISFPTLSKFIRVGTSFLHTASSCSQDRLFLGDVAESFRHMWTGRYTNSTRWLLLPENDVEKLWALRSHLQWWFLPWWERAVAKKNFKWLQSAWTPGQNSLLPPQFASKQLWAFAFPGCCCLLRKYSQSL